MFFIAHSVNGLPSAKFDTRQKKNGLPSVFPKYTRQMIFVCRVFLRITLGKPIFQRKNNNFFLSIPLLFREYFRNYTRQTYFPKKKKWGITLASCHLCAACSSARTGSLWSYCSKSMGNYKMHETFISNQIPSNPKIDHTQVRNWLFKTSCYHFPIRYRTWQFLIHRQFHTN